MTSDTEFHPWPKIHRLTGNTARMVITEKIDGTNGQILVHRTPVFDGFDVGVTLDLGDGYVGKGYVRAGSRKRWITPEADNFGFSDWVWENAQALADLLGEGRHYGEWYGKGIQHGYGLDERRFALFNVHRWNGTIKPNDIGLEVVPTLYDGAWSPDALNDECSALAENGSVAVPNWDRAEGVIVQHLPSRHTYKVLLENNDLPKSAVERIGAAA